MDSVAESLMSLSSKQTVTLRLTRTHRQLASRFAAASDDFRLTARSCCFAWAAACGRNAQLCTAPHCAAQRANSTQVLRAAALSAEARRAAGGALLDLARCAQ